MIKTCDICNKEKDKELDFSQRRRVCRTCYTASRSEYHKQYREENRERIREINNRHNKKRRQNGIR